MELLGDGLAAVCDGCHGVPDQVPGSTMEERSQTHTRVENEMTTQQIRELARHLASAPGEQCGPQLYTRGPVQATPPSATRQPHPAA